jgi:hypothetical protein
VALALIHPNPGEQVADLADATPVMSARAAAYNR